MRSFSYRAVRNLAILLPVVALDQASKWLAATRLARGEATELFPFLNLSLRFNTGVSFGLFPAGSAGGVAMLVLMTALIIILLSAWSLVTPKPHEGLALSLIIGGAVGNLVDRIRAGMVTDFIDINVAGYHWPTFNLADIAISLGVAWLLLHDLRVPAGPWTSPARGPCRRSKE